MAHNRRRVDHNCHAGRQFNYFCVDCCLDLLGWDNKNEVAASANGWTWELKRNGEEIDSSGTELVRKYGGTEEEALRDGLKRFDEEPCKKPN